MQLEPALLNTGCLCPINAHLISLPHITLHSLFCSFSPSCIVYVQSRGRIVEQVSFLGAHAIGNNRPLEMNSTRPANYQVSQCHTPMVLTVYTLHTHASA